MIEKYIRLSESRAAALFIAIVFVGKIYAVLTYGADFALFPAVYNMVFCPPHCWTFSTSIPYSIMWYYLNLFFLFPDTFAGRFDYGVYIILFDALTTLGFWQIKRIPKRYLALLQGMSIMFYLGQGSEYQNVTILALLPLMFLVKSSKWKLGIVAALPILIKLPIGWSLPWVMNPHVECVWLCSGFTIVKAWYSLVMDAISNYGILVFSWYFTLQWVRGRYGK
jgi:hypothetical protein